MALLTYADRVAETTTTTGTGTIQLGGAVDGKFRTFVAGAGSGNTVPYVLVHRTANEWEVGYGVVTSGSPDTLTRAGVYSSSNGGSAVNFSAGTKDVFLGLPAGKTVTFDDTTGAVTIASATVSGDLTVDTSTLKVDSANNRVGIGTASPAAPLHVSTATAAGRTNVIFANPAASNTANRIRLQLGPASGFSGTDLYPYVESYISDAANSFAGLKFGTYNGSVVDAMTLDASGNLGLGVTPSAWDASIRAIDTFGASFASQTPGGGAYLTGNAYLSNGGTWRYQGTGTAYLQQMSGGAFQWYNASSGTAGNPITFTERARITAGGNFGIGTTNPTDRLEVQGGNVKEITSTSVSVLKYGKKTTIAQSSSSNPVVDLLTIGNVAVGTLVRVTVFQYDGSAANANVHIGYAYIRSSSGSVTAMSAQGGFGTQNVGTLSWSGQTLRYTANRVGNFDIYAITVEVASESSVSGW